MHSQHSSTRHDEADRYGPAAGKGMQQRYNADVVTDVIDLKRKRKRNRKTLNPDPKNGPFPLTKLRNPVFPEGGTSWPDQTCALPPKFPNLPCGKTGTPSVIAPPLTQGADLFHHSPTEIPVSPDRQGTGSPKKVKPLEHKPQRTSTPLQPGTKKASDFGCPRTP